MPVNVFKADFHELYRRHRGRHSQLGINVIHMIAVLGIYFALMSLVNALTGSPRVSIAAAVIYTGVLAFAVPWSVLTLNTLLTAVLLWASYSLILIPVWAGMLLVFGCHRLQLLSHRLYYLESDMSEFSTKYPKGPALFLLLAVYELPLLIQYLIFDYRGWICTSRDRLPSGLRQTVR